MNKYPRPFALILLILFGFGPGQSLAVTLYQWQEPSGETRFGYRPPAGVVGKVVGGKLRQSGGMPNPVNCRELQQDNLRLVDLEIERVRNMHAGFGVNFEFTPEAKQHFINDLLILRSALVTGRSADEFAPQDNRRQLASLKEKFKKNESNLVDELETQAQQIQQQRQELERQRIQTQFYMQMWWMLRPGFIFIR